MKSFYFPLCYARKKYSHLSAAASWQSNDNDTRLRSGCILPKKQKNTAMETGTTAISIIIMMTIIIFVMTVNWERG